MALMDHKLSLEYRDVALRPHHLSAARTTQADVLEFIEAIEAVAEPVMVTRRPRPLFSDPNDDMILDLAINGGGDAIVTNHARHFRLPARGFGIAVLAPSELLAILRAKGRVDEYAD